MNEKVNITKNSEIDEALREFEAKDAGQKQKDLEILRSSAVPKKETSGISYETDSYRTDKYSNEPDLPKMVRLVMKLSGGAIKEQKQAEYVLFGAAIFMLLLSFYFFFK